MLTIEKLTDIIDLDVRQRLLRAKIEHGERSSPLELPTRDVIAEYLAAEFRTIKAPEHAALNFKRRANPPKDASRKAKAFVRMFQWHLGGPANLGTLVNCRFDLGPDYDQAENLAIALLQIMGLQSRSLNRWRNVLGGDL